MKVSRAVWPFPWLFLLLPGCQKHAQVVTFIVPPGQQQPYLYANPAAKIEWYSDPALGSSGFPFTVSTNLPCRTDKSLKSDGKEPATCDLKDGDTGSFWISVNPDKLGKDHKPRVGTGPIVMRVGPCTGCTSYPSDTGRPPADNPADSVILACDSTNTGRAMPADLPASVGDQVYWTYAGGHYPPNGSDAFVVQLDAGVCSNYSGAAKLTKDSNFCTVAKSATYSFTVYGCPNPGKGTISAQ